MQSSSVESLQRMAVLLGTPVITPQEQAGLASWQVPVLRLVDLRPQLMLMVRSLVVEQALTFRRDPITAIPRGLLVSFQNVFMDGHEDAVRLAQQQTHVRVLPLHTASEVTFAPRTHVKQLTLLVEATYLQELLGEKRHEFAYLLEADTTFWLEEFMSPGIAALVEELVHAGDQVVLPDFYYRLKALALLYELFASLAQRVTGTSQSLSETEIQAVYRVRAVLAASLERVTPVSELVKLSGLNELKLRRLFTQVFGKGLYAYAQQLRMQEAARLLQDGHLSVAEVGYRLGFSNLSYFGRLFEAHFGLKPKKWSMSNRK